MTMPPSPKMRNENTRVYRKLRTLWGTREFNDYASELCVPNRDVNREGFSFAVLLELTSMVDVHTLTFPELNKGLIDIWAASSTNPALNGQRISKRDAEAGVYMIG